MLYVSTWHLNICVSVWRSNNNNNKKNYISANRELKLRFLSYSKTVRSSNLHAHDEKGISTKKKQGKSAPSTHTTNKYLK